MPSYEITSTIEPDHDPARTTGDQVAATSLVVEWSSEPTYEELRRFENMYPPHLYSAFHYVEGVGKVGE